MVTKLLLCRSADNSISYENVTYIFLPVTAETASLQDSLSKAFTEKLSESDEIVSKSFFSNIPELLPFVFMRFMWKTNEKVQAKILKVKIIISTSYKLFL